VGHTLPLIAEVDGTEIPATTGSDLVDANIGAGVEMKIVVLGGGVVGVTTAYQLQQDGHEVTVIERQPSVAEETSWGNAGMIAPGHSFAWSSPQAPMILLKSLVLKNQALRFKPSLDPRLWTWSLKFLAQCTSEKAALNTLRKHRLALYSQSVLHEVVDRENIQFDNTRKGIIYFYRDEASLERGFEHMQILANDGQEIRRLTTQQVIELEPALAANQHKIAGAVYAPTDETGDCNKFTAGLARICQERGAEFLTGTTVKGFNMTRGEISGVATDRGEVKGDLYVLSLGSYSPMVARTVNIDLPIYPVKGYTLTIPVGNHGACPKIGCVDENNLVAISPLGDRIRATATAEFAGYDASHRPSDFAFMKSVVQELYPDAADYDRAHMWAGLRPMTPTNMPIIGPSRYRNLFFNTGHGHIGWTMSNGSARIAADMIAGRTPAIPLDGLAA
jgi:D-amino-acid dehydrogenase